MQKPSFLQALGIACALFAGREAHAARSMPFGMSGADWNLLAYTWCEVLIKNASSIDQNITMRWGLKQVRRPTEIAHYTGTASDPTCAAPSFVGTPIPPLHPSLAANDYVPPSNTATVTFKLTSTCNSVLVRGYFLNHMTNPVLPYYCDGTIQIAEDRGAITATASLYQQDTVGGGPVNLAIGVNGGRAF